MASDSLVGRVLHDTHKILRLVGRGGMGAVYEAHHVRLIKKRYAVKVLDLRQAEDKTNYVRFRREAEIVTDLGHPNIVEVLDFYETRDGRVCTVMEYLEGEDLAAVLKREGKLQPWQVVEIATQVGSALRAVHEKGIVHRDLKPANIFISSGAAGGLRVKVLDFGISKIRDSSSLTGDRMVLGTPHYMAPEQAEGKVGELDHRTDIFALGTLCYEMLSGRLPFEAPSLLGVIRKICDKPHPKLSSQMPGLGPDVDQVIDQALAKDKKERYPRADLFVVALKVALEASPIACAPGLSTGPDRRSGFPGETSIDAETIEAPRRHVPRNELAPEAPTRILEPSEPPDAGSPVLNTEVVSVEELFGEGGQVVGDATASKISAKTVLVDDNLYLDKVPTTTTLTTAAGELPGPRWDRHRLPVFLITGLAVVALAIVGVYLGLQLGTTDQAPAGVPLSSAAKKPIVEPLTEPATPVRKTPAVAPLPAAAPANAQVEKVTITLRLDPPGAIAKLDNQPVRKGALLLEKNGKMHQLEVAAEGYVPQVMTFLADQDQALDVRLEKRPIATKAPAVRPTSEGYQSLRKKDPKKSRIKKPTSTSKGRVDRNDYEAETKTLKRKEKNEDTEDGYDEL